MKSAHDCTDGQGASTIFEKRRLQREIRLTLAFIVATLVASALATVDVVSIFLQHAQTGSLVAALEQSVFIIIVAFLVYGNLIYQFTRLQYLKRTAAHCPVDTVGLRSFFNQGGKGLTVLVPSYKEEPHVIAQTLISAALQVYPERRVVLLIDNPPNSSSPEDQRLLEHTRALTGKIEAMLEHQSLLFNTELERFQESIAYSPVLETQKLSRLYDEAAAWFEDQANSYKISDHTDRLFVEKVFTEPSALYRDYAKLLTEEEAMLTRQEIEQEYMRLATLFKVKLFTFERKKYVNLSHESNKAMNLNSYLGLMGGEYREVSRNGEAHLEPCTASNAEFIIPDTEFVATIDADTILSHDYSARLLQQLEEPGNERVAVIQTPYSAVPQAPGMLERIAGATTDIQYIIHQGFTHYRATFWVGANALIRKSALEDIVTTQFERGFEVRRYIQDRTVIEDTESSIDLVDRGWSLLNYPQRLAYSATPPDFGALLIQRRRWANGGLIILPKLLRYLVRRPRTQKKMVEGVVRVHYLTSIAAVNIGLLLLFTYPFKENMQTFWLPLTAVPYFYLYGRDLVSLRYKWSDTLRVYALNMSLIPINLGGVFKSISQGITGKRIPFFRTPKVGNRTAVHSVYVVAVLAIATWCLVCFVADLGYERWGHAVFMLLNGISLFYAITNFMGWRECFQDLGLSPPIPIGNSPQSVPTDDVMISTPIQRSGDASLSDCQAGEDDAACSGMQSTASGRISTPAKFTDHAV
jgi:cellulose synthase/poly-beta-1,6-N-acetylglucosamine synthase-like glycosyltransferase